MSQIKKLFRTMCVITVSFVLYACVSSSINYTKDKEKEDSVCLDKNDKEIAKDCNDYINSLYDMAPDPDKIMDPVTQKGTLVTKFKRPFLYTSGQERPDAHAYAGYTPFQYEAATELYKIEGYLGSDMIIIFLQGGPSPALVDSYMQIFEDDFLVAYVQQTNVVKKDLLDSYDLSTQEAKKEIDEDIAIAFAAYKDIKQRFPDKRIALAGHSMGCFLVLKYLADHGNSFDKVIAMACRIDTPLDFVRYFSLGQDVIYDYIGGDRERYMQMVGSANNSIKELAHNDDYLVKDYVPGGGNVILSYLGLQRYSTLLKDTDLSNMLFVYSDKDEQLDGLSPAEISFLTDRGAQVVNSGWDKEVLGHSRMLYRIEYLRAVKTFLESE